MKLRKYLAALLAVLVVAVMLPSTHAYALSDLDFTINVDNSKEYVTYRYSCRIYHHKKHHKKYKCCTMVALFHDDSNRNCTVKA